MRAAEASALIEPIAAEIRAIAGADYFGSDDETLASVVGKLLLQAEQTVSVAESCTGGGLGAMLTEIAGSSAYFWGGIIAYSNRVKISRLDVDAEDLTQFGAVSAIVAKQMAIGVKQSLASDWGVSITGIAGPGGDTELKPIGLVYLGLAAPDGSIESYEYHFGRRRSRSLIRHLSACNALDRLRRRLLTEFGSET